MEDLLTINETAKLINVHPETLRRWDKEGTLVAIKINNRGDRRYKKNEIIEFIKTHKDTILHTQKISYSGYVITWWNDNGFLTTQGNFDLLAKIVVTNDNEFIGFAFYVSLISKYKSTEKDLDKLAIDTVKKYLDTKKALDGDMFTFEFDNTSFREIQNPEWWDTRYSKSLVQGLKIEAHATYPNTMILNKTWRVILHFKSKQNDCWLTSTFGKNNSSEYFVWVTSDELSKKGLPNTMKGAEIFAVDYVIKRFDETRDENGNRDITRINENNTACYDGKCVKDSLLPDELMK